MKSSTNSFLYVELYRSVYRGAFCSSSLNLVNWVVEWVVFRPKRQEVLSPSDLELHCGALVLPRPTYWQYLVCRFYHIEWWIKIYIIFRTNSHAVLIIIFSLLVITKQVIYTHCTLSPSSIFYGFRSSCLCIRRSDSLEFTAGQSSRFDCRTGPVSTRTKNSSVCLFA